MEDGFGLSGISTIRDGVPWATRSRNNKAPERGWKAVWRARDLLGCAKVTKDPGEVGWAGQRKT